ncbi:MAG: triphosphoribosyl-dephospho-CoA synthase [Halorubrum sp.]
MTPNRTVVDDAVLALLLEVAGTPKPGNVDRRRDLADLHFEAFLGGAVGAREGLARAARGATVGHAFDCAVAGMTDRAGTNTQFGCLLLLVPLLRATADGDLSPTGVERVTRETTVDDAVRFYRAFERVDVAVADPPPDATDLDVRRGRAVEPTLRDRELTLRDVMATAASPGESRVPDRNAQEWIEGFPRTFRAAAWIREDVGPIADRAARAFLGLLATEPDTLVATTHDPETAREASARAAERIEADVPREVGPGADGRRPDAEAVHAIDLDAAESLATAFVDEGINPGTTADLTCAALYVALRHGVSVGDVGLPDQGPEGSR